MKEIKSAIASNIYSLRTGSGMTQAELAEKLCYSDKAISKWERAESVPDLTALMKVADIFDVSLDQLTGREELKASDNEKNDAPADESIREGDRLSAKNTNHLITAVISLLGVWFIATVVFTILYVYDITFWLVFIIAVPISAIVLIVFNALWGPKKLNVWLVSVLIWSLLLMLYLIFIEKNIWLIFMIGIPAQAAEILAFKYVDDPALKLKVEEKLEQLGFRK